PVAPFKGDEQAADRHTAALGNAVEAAPGLREDGLGSAPEYLAIEHFVFGFKRHRRVAFGQKDGIGLACRANRDGMDHGAPVLVSKRMDDDTGRQYRGPRADRWDYLGLRELPSLRVSVLRPRPSAFAAFCRCPALTAKAVSSNTRSNSASARACTAAAPPRNSCSVHSARALLQAGLCAGTPWRIAAGRSATWICRPLASTARRRQRFSSWRTLPGQGSSRSAARAPAANRLGSRPASTLAWARKCVASAAMSSLRSRSGGKLRRTTSRRCSRSARNSPRSTLASRS